MTPPAAAAAPAVHPRRTTGPVRVPSRPRRVSGPVRPIPGRAPAARPERDGLVVGALGLLDSLSRHRLLDRLIRGRTAIVIVAFALIGIVTLQLGLLKLNASIGRTLEHQALLQRENATLAIEDSELTAGARVESNAARLNMQLVPVGGLRFLTARPGSDPARAAAALRAAPAPGAGEAREAGSSRSTSSPSSASSGSSAASSGEASESGSSTTATPEAKAEAKGEATTGSAESTSAGGETGTSGREASGSSGAPAAAAAPSSSGSSGAPEASSRGGVQAGGSG